MNPCKTKQEYLNQVIEPARRVCKRYGYLPSVLIAQACLENGYGMDPSCHVLIGVNNMVGQKSELLNKSWTDIGLSVWPGKSITKRTPEQYGGQIVYINDNFRIFDSIEQSLADFLLFLTYASNSGPGGTPKYGGEVLSIKDPETLIRAVGGRGYATGQTYPTSVMRIVREHNLTQYDNLTSVEMTDQIPPALKKDPKIVINQNPMGIRTHNTSKRTSPIEYICIHYVGALGDAKANIDYYNQTSVTDASADFYCGHNGDIWQYNVRPLERYCWAVGGGRQSQCGGTYYGICKNGNSISIEMCVKSKTGRAPAYPNDPNWYITDATVDACVKLTKYLMKLYGIDKTHVIRHFDVNGKYCPGVVGWNGPSGSDAAWLAFKDRLSGDTPVPTPTPTPTPGKNYRVRVGIYKYQSYLEKLRANIKAKTGLDCFTEQQSDGTHVYCGSFSSRKNADTRAQLLRNAGFDTAIEEV